MQNDCSVTKEIIIVTILSLRNNSLKKFQNKSLNAVKHQADMVEVAVAVVAINATIAEMNDRSARMLSEWR